MSVKTEKKIILSSEFYCASSFVVLKYEDGCAVVRVFPGNSLTIVSHLEYMLIEHCRDSRDLVAQAESFVEKFNLRPCEHKDILKILRVLVTKGLLIACDQLTVRPVHFVPPILNTLTVPTRNRPRLLFRTLESFCRNARQYARSLNILVIDDSNSNGYVAQNKDVLRLLEKKFTEHTFRYADRFSRQVYCQKLSTISGVDQDLVEFGLLGMKNFSSVGAVRNAMLLATRGENFVSVDDDILCEITHSLQISQELVLSGGASYYSHWFLNDGERIKRAFKIQSIDHFKQHESILGFPLNQLATGSNGKLKIKLRDTNWSTLNNLSNMNSKVLLTMMGVRGDPGIASMASHLFLRGENRKRLLRNPKIYKEALLGRMGLNCVENVILGNGPIMAGVLGIDNSRGDLPPFFPNFRSEDQMYRQMLRISHGRDIFAYLPYSLAHRPPEKRRETVRSFWAKAMPIRFNDTLSLMLGEVRPYDHAVVKKPIERVGKFIGDFTSLSKLDFEMEIQRLWIFAIEKRTNELEMTLSQKGLPSFYRKDLVRYIERIRQRIGGQSLLELDDFSVKSRSGLDFQAVSAKYGHLCSHWQTLVRGSKQLTDSGINITERIMTRNGHRSSRIKKEALTP